MGAGACPQSRVSKEMMRPTEMRNIYVVVIQPYLILLLFTIIFVSTHMRVEKFGLFQILFYQVVKYFSSQSCKIILTRKSKIFSAAVGREIIFSE